MKQVSKFIFMALCLLPLTGFSQTKPNVIFTEDAIEADKISVSINKRLSGSITAAKCPTCSPIRLKINKHTQAFHNGQLVHLIKVKEANGKAAIVFYDLKTKIVNRIKW